MKLMLIEENAGLRRLLHTLLAPSGAQICECVEGTEAASLSALEAPDWIVLDLNLAHADGWQVLAQLHTTCPQARVVLLADEMNARLRRQVRAAGATQLVLKENLLDLPPLLSGA